MKLVSKGMAMLENITSYRPAPVATPVADTKSDLGLKSLTDKAQEGKDALTALKQARKKQNESARDMAYQRVLRVLERIKALKAMKASDPIQSAKVITQLAKELRDALKAYLATGGKAGDLAGSGAASTPSTPSPAPSEGEAAKSETAAPESTTTPEVKSPINPYAPPGQPQPEDASFLKDIRELVKALKALLLREVNKSQGDPKADPKVFEAAQKEILKLEKDLDDAQRDLAQAALSSGSHTDTTA